MLIRFDSKDFGCSGVAELVSIRRTEGTFEFFTKDVLADDGRKWDDCVFINSEILGSTDMLEKFVPQGI